MGSAESIELEVSGKTLKISNPQKIFFAQRSETKLDLINYYLQVGDAVVRAVKDRPTVLKRYPDGAEGSFFFQKRVPQNRPDWLRSSAVTFASGNQADELCPQDLAHVVWAVNLGALGLDPWPVRSDDLDHPDELRVDLDPQPNVPFSAVRTVANEVAQLLSECSIQGYPKTSGSRGIHIYVRLQRRWDFDQLRRSALALAREVERRVPTLATSAWWKRDRGEKIFIDYNQNARDRTIASAYSVRANAHAQVSCPLLWDEVAVIEPQDLTMQSVPGRLEKMGDPWATMDHNAFSLEPLLEMAERDASAGIPEAPLPPRFSRKPA